MWQNRTENAVKATFFAIAEAGKLGQREVSTEHFLLGLIRERDCVASRVLVTLGLNLDRIQLELEKQISASDALAWSAEMSMSEAVNRSVIFANEEARALGNNYIGTEHLLLGLMREEESIAEKVLTQLGASLEAARAEIVKLQSQEMS